MSPHARPRFTEVGVVFCAALGPPWGRWALAPRAPLLRESGTFRSEGVIRPRPGRIRMTPCLSAGIDGHGRASASRCSFVIHGSLKAYSQPQV